METNNRINVERVEHKTSEKMKKTNFILTAILLICLPFLLVKNPVWAQKKESSLQLSFLKKADQSKNILLTVKARNEAGKFAPAPNASLSIFIKSNEEWLLIKTLISDLGGKASMKLADDLPMDNEKYFSIMAKIENDSRYEDAEEELRVKESRLTLLLDPTDTNRILTATVTQTGNDGEPMPVQEAEVKFYVERLFGKMPVGEEFVVATDAAGKATYALPKNIPSSDTLGNLTIVAVIENNETFGTVESNASAKWGVPLQWEKDPFPRALWEPRAPPAMILFFAIVFGGIWLTYFFVIFQLIKVHSETKIK
jgi:hypothetical protein